MYNNFLISSEFIILLFAPPFSWLFCGEVTETSTLPFFFFKSANILPTYITYITNSPFFKINSNKGAKILPN